MKKPFRIYLLTDIWDEWNEESYEDFFHFPTSDEAVREAESLARAYEGHILVLEVDETLPNGDIRDVWDYEDGLYGPDDD